MVLADDRVRVRMYRGFREVVDGFTKNVAYVFDGWIGLRSSSLTTCLLVRRLALPLAVLAAALARGAGPPGATSASPPRPSASR